jgi:hypothetical protein
MRLHQIPERWATVWGVGWDYEVVEVPLWEPMSPAQFSGSDCIGGHINKFREVTDWVYTKPQASLTPMYRPKDWQQRRTAAQEWFLKERQAVIDEATGFTNVAGYSKLREWQANQRPDLEPPGSMDWAYESIRLERQASVC